MTTVRVPIYDPSYDPANPPDFFEYEFFEFEANRMFPPNYRKETAMKKPARRHIYAITRVQRLLETGVDVANKPKLAKSINDDIALLCEVRDILYQIIENPSLPFVIHQLDSVQPILDQINAEPNGAF